MEPSFQTSFIPKTNGAGTRRAVLSDRHFDCDCSFYFVCGGFGNRRSLSIQSSLTKQIGDMQEQLNTTKNRFEPSRITELSY